MRFSTTPSKLSRRNSCTPRFARCARVELAFTTISTPSPKSAMARASEIGTNGGSVNDDPVKGRT